jgi:hypothetical protein
MVAVLELDEGTAALPAGVLRELGFGGGGGVALVHGGSGLGPAGCLSYSRLVRRTREFGVDGGGQTLGQTAKFRQTAPEIGVSPGFATHFRPALPKTVKHPGRSAGAT